MKKRTLRQDVEKFLETTQAEFEKRGPAYYDSDLAAEAFVAIGNGTFNFINNSLRARAAQDLCNPKRKRR